MKVSDTPYGPPPAGWYMLGGDPNDLAYSDGRAWTWRRWQLPGGEWRQEPILPPRVTAPDAMRPPAATTGWSTGPWDPGQGQGQGPGYPGTPGGYWGAREPTGPGGPSSYGSPPTSPPGRLDLHLSEPRPQARWKTFLRGLLVVPNAVVLAFLWIAVTLVTIVMWCSALVTARVPEAMWRFSKGVLQWGVRTTAYEVFLTDTYPPFRTGDVAYPVSMTLDPPDRFNRLAVLFRVVLAVPTAIVATVFLWGIYVLSVVTWFVTLVLGRCPRSLHLVLAAWLRYQFRYNAYYWLLTTEYPSAPLGDHRSGYGSLESGEIVLSGTSRALAVVTLVVGALFYLSITVLPTIFGSHARARTAVAQWNALQSRTTTAETRFQTRTAGCAQTWHCIASALPIAARSLVTQISTIETITFPTTQTRHDASAILSVLGAERSAVSQIQDARTQQGFDSGLQHVVTLTHRLQPLVLKLQDDLASVP